jgi:hypothetical protein
MSVNSRSAIMARALRCGGPERLATCGVDMNKCGFLVGVFALPFVIYVQGCSGASTSSGLGCSLDPACYVVSATGECSIDVSASCVDGAWHCGPHGTLGSGCMPDGGIAPPPMDAGTCPLDMLSPPLACNDDSTCSPYGGTCVFPALNGPGECVCRAEPQDSGIGADGCTGPGCGVCTLPSFTITCNGPSDTTTCAQYGALCEGVGPYACACVAVDPPRGLVSGD